MNLLFQSDNLVWQSDWSGDEVGYPEILIVGLYTYQPNDGPNIHLYIDSENQNVLEMWTD